MAKGEGAVEVELLDARIEGEETWFRLSSGHLSQPVELKVRIQPGRATIIGLRIDNGREVSSSELRLPLLQLADTILDWLTALGTEIRDDLDHAHGTVRERGLQLDPSRLDDLLAGVVAPTQADEWLLTIADLAWAQASLERLNEELADDDARPAGRGRGAKPPTDEDYEKFAQLYDAERRAKAWGAQARTARRLNMDRSTALRWIRVCEERGLLERSET